MGGIFSFFDALRVGWPAYFSLFRTRLCTSKLWGCCFFPGAWRTEEKEKENYDDEVGLFGGYGIIMFTTRPTCATIAGRHNPFVRQDGERQRESSDTDANVRI